MFQPNLLYTFATPNPNCYKFAFDVELVAGGPYQFEKQNLPYNIPLIDLLLDMPDIVRLYIMSNFISITKTPDNEWYEVAADARTIFQNYLDLEALHSDAILKGYRPAIESTHYGLNDWYARTILPATEKDGGAIFVRSFEDGVLTLEPAGACLGCPHIQITVGKGIETPLSQTMPEFKSVNILESF